MKKILLVGTEDHFPYGAFAFLKSIQQTEPVSVTGLFFGPIEYGPMITASEIPAAGPYLRLREKEKKMVDDNKALFMAQCTLNHIKFHVHPNEDQWDKDVLARESRFSDLVLIGHEQFYSDVNSDQPNLFLQEALHASECPVVVVPENYAPLERLVFAYDGGKASLYAMKQFCFLFPEYTDLPAEIIYVKDEQGPAIPDIDQLKAYVSLQFSSLNFSKLHFKAADYFTTWIGDKHRALIVCGSFGRSPFSYITHRSFAEKLIRDHRMPVFIAHY